MNKTRLRQVSVVVLISASAALLAACTSSANRTYSAQSNKKRPKEYFAESIYGVKASPRVTNKRSRLQRGGGRDQIGKPYQVRGKWYYPKEEPGYKKVGMASWYGDAFHGRLTANGEVYDMTHLTAAHPTMPLPSYARVTNVENGASVIVRVNDRGPYDSGRVIDLSHKAADMLGYTQTGTAKVKVEYVGRARMDGQDESYLVASYLPGNSRPDPSVGMPTGVMVAMNGSTPSSKKASPFPGNMTLGSADGFEPAPANVPALALPDNGPNVLRRPEEAVALASMSYSAKPANGAAAAFASMASDEDASWKQGRALPNEYVLVGTYRNVGEIDRLKKALEAFGASDVQQSKDDKGRLWYSLNLVGDGRHSTDEMLEAAWAAGAPDAMTVHD